MSEENKAVVRRWIAAWNERGADGVDELFSLDFTDQQLARALGGPVTLDALKAWLQTLEGALGRAQFTEQELVAEGDQVVVRWTMEGTHQGPYLGLPATGQPFRVDGVNIFRVVDGRIAERWSFVDVPALIAQLGGRVVPAGDTARPGPRLPPRWLIRLAWIGHRAIYRVTGGRRGLRLPTPGRFGMLRLTTVGRRSGKERAVILGYYEDGPNLITLAMNGWGAGEPAWWLNLRARPEAYVTLKHGARAVRARAAQGEERQRLWEGFRAYAGWGNDLDALARRRPTETAVVVLEPRA